MRETEQPSSLKEKMEGVRIVEQTDDDMAAIMDRLEENEVRPETKGREPNASDILSREEVDELLGEIAPEEDTRLKDVTPERIAHEWEQLSETARSVVWNASDEKFKEITEKYKNIPDTERKVEVMIIMRRLISSNHPLASKINAPQEKRQKA